MKSDTLMWLAVIGGAVYLMSRTDPAPAAASLPAPALLPEALPADTPDDELPVLGEADEGADVFEPAGMAGLGATAPVGAYQTIRDSVTVRAGSVAGVQVQQAPVYNSRLRRYVYVGDWARLGALLSRYGLQHVSGGGQGSWLTLNVRASRAMTVYAVRLAVQASLSGAGFRFSWLGVVSGADEVMGRRW